MLFRITQTQITNIQKVEEIAIVTIFEPLQTTHWRPLPEEGTIQASSSGTSHQRLHFAVSQYFSINEYRLAIFISTSIM